MSEVKSNPRTRIEYRVRWRRQERGQTTKVYQSWSSAYRKVRGILAMEAVKDDTSFDTMPPLAEGPVIESRPVGDWELVECEMPPVREYEKDNMAMWAGYTNPKREGPVNVPF